MSQTEEISKKRVPVYVKRRIAGENKKQAMIAAGYTESYTKAPSLLEATKVYNNVIKSILHNTTGIINETIATARLDELAKLPIKERVTVLKQLAEIHRILVPTIKIKEEELADGGIKRTKWSSIGDN